MKKLPKQIYVQLINKDSRDEYLQAEVLTSEIAEDGEVGIYELKSIKKRKTTYEIK